MVKNLILVYFVIFSRSKNLTLVYFTVYFRSMNLTSFFSQSISVGPNIDPTLLSSVRTVIKGLAAQPSRLFLILSLSPPQGRLRFKSQIGMVWPLRGSTFSLGFGFQLGLFSTLKQKNPHTGDKASLDRCG